MSQEKMPAFGLYAMLIDVYECIEMSEQAPEDPLCPDMDADYKWYKNKRGLLFAVPPPDDDNFYSSTMIENIMENGQLKRIVPFSKVVEKDSNSSELVEKNSETSAK